MEELSLLSERMERAAMTDLHAAAGDEIRRRLGMSLREIGGALVSASSGEPSTLLNRTISQRPGVHPSDRLSDGGNQAVWTSGARRHTFCLSRWARRGG